MSNAGRPYAITDNVLALLHEAFSYGASDIEACQYAGISKDALYNYQQRNPEFTDQKARLKEMPKFRAKRNIVDAISDGDTNISQWYLERKGKDEFSTRNEHTGADGEDLVIKWEEQNE